jgi:hypothetical protein
MTRYQPPTSTTKNAKPKNYTRVAKLHAKLTPRRIDVKNSLVRNRTREFGKRDRHNSYDLKVYTRLAPGNHGIAR